jgi:spore maturation protein CgeB
MSAPGLHIVILGLSITSSWGNGHATTYRGLVRGLAARGHDVLFLERDAEWYAANRDLPRPPHGRTVLYHSLGELKRRFTAHVRDADLVIVGSYVPDGARVGEWVTRVAHGVAAFYDIDTPVTLAHLARGEADYLTRALVPRYHLYLSFTGGPTLERLEQEFGAQAARALYCSVDPATYRPEPAPARYDLGYMGTYSADRQRGLTHLLMEPARLWWEGRFAVAGPQYPASIRWPANVRRIEHLSPALHRGFYNAQRFTLNITRADMIAAGFSPSVRLFEAAACGTPIVSDAWDGIDEVLTPGREVLLARSAADVLAYVRDLPDEERLAIGARARARILAEHTAAHRAEELEGYVLGLLAREPSG